MKTIFFVIATHARVNFVLRTDTFRVLKEKGFRLVIISPFSDDQKFRKEFGGDNVVFEVLPHMSGLGKKIDMWRREALYLSHPTITFVREVHSHITRRYRTSARGTVIAAIRKVLLALLPDRIRTSILFWNRLEDRFIHNEMCEQLFKKYEPSAVLTASAGAEGDDLLFAIYTRRLEIPMFVIDSNIDVFEFRYFSTPRSVRTWALFSEIQKKEAQEIQQLKEENISLTGPGRYDHYLRDFKPEDRETFLKKIGADPKRKLVTYGAKNPKMYPHNGDIISIIKEAIKDFGKEDSQLFIRFDPGHDPKEYDNLLDDCTWERADEVSHRDHVANLLYHSDVVISIGSTFCNEACLVDTPSVWVGFDGFTQYKDSKDSYGFIYGLPLFKRLIKTGGIPLTKTPKELKEKIIQYLKDPSLNKNNRRMLIEQEYGVLDGGAGERIANVVMEQIK